jgi:hypothetical protein
MWYPGRHRRLVSLFAALVLLMGSVAPAISAMLVPQRAHGLLEICTVEGTVLVAAPDGFGDPEPARSAGHGFEHCPFCAPHAPILHAPPAASAVLHLQGLTEARPPAFLFAPRTLHAWTSAQPRAPPLFS